MIINIFKNKYKQDILKNRGLTLVELMVVISIFSIITSVTIFNYASFRSNVSIQNLSDDVALAIRKAQSFAIGVRASKGGSFENSYGVHFSINSNHTDQDGSLSGYNKSFLMFSDITNPSNRTKVYDYDVSNIYCSVIGVECIELFKITTPDVIKDIIYYDNLGGVVSSIDNGNTQASIDIVFTRPSPGAEFCYRVTTNPSESCNPITISSMGIVISNGQTDATKKKTKTIYVQNTGQISIQ